jgi:hypothetical protein
LHGVGNPSHSWLLGDTRTLAIILAVLAALAFVATGGGFLAQQDRWPATAVAAGAVAGTLMGLYFNPWLLAGSAISAGIIVAGIHALPQA